MGICSKNKKINFERPGDILSRFDSVLNSFGVGDGLIENDLVRELRRMKKSVEFVHKCEIWLM